MSEQQARPARALAAKVNSLIQAELARCKRSMKPADWAEHREWIEEHVIACARLWMREQALIGEIA